MKKFRFAACMAAVVFTAALVGCGKTGTEGDISYTNIDGGEVIFNDGAATVGRGSGDAVGIMIRRSAVMVHFTVEGEGAEVHYRYKGDSYVLPIAPDYSIMVGPEGAVGVTVVSTTGDSVSVKVTEIVDCATAPAGTCTPPSAERPEPAAVAPDAAPAPPAAP